MPFEEKITVRVRTHYSLYHLQAAFLFTQLSGKVENNYKANATEAIHVKHRSYVTAAMLSSVAFLEATINEVFADTVDSPKKFVGRLDPNTVKLMASIWQVEEFNRHFKILDKYQIALKLANKLVFDKGESPYQDVPLFIKLRNALVHYKPVWTTLRSENPDIIEEHYFEKMLKGKFSLNPLAAEGSIFYPNKCISHGCAEWTVVTSEKFATAFFSRMKLVPVYEHVRPTLTTK